MKTVTIPVKTTKIDLDLDVQARLEQLGRFRAEYAAMDADLDRLAAAIDPEKRVDRQKGAQIDDYRLRNRIMLIQEPIELSSEAMDAVGYGALRRHLIAQFAGLTPEEQMLWLHNFLFIMTPDLWRLLDKIALVMGDFALGQQRNFMLGGKSGMGKTTFLNFLWSLYRPRVDADRNIVPIVKADAPDSTNSPKALPTRMLMEYGSGCSSGDTVDDLRAKLKTFRGKCRTIMYIGDEIENITNPRLKEQFVDLSNALCGSPIILASPHPQRFLESASDALKGRFNDIFELTECKGDDLKGLLNYINLLLPFTEDSNLDDDRMVQVVQQRTKGRFRYIMRLIELACVRVIKSKDLTHITPELLETVWDEVESKVALPDYYG